MPDGFEPQIAKLGAVYHKIVPLAQKVEALKNEVKRLADEAEDAAVDLRGFAFWEVGYEDPARGAYEVGQIQYHIEEAAAAARHASGALAPYGTKRIGVR